MDQKHVHGIIHEGRTLCLSCAKRIYGSSLEMYLNSHEVQILTDQERSQYASQGLLCDECLSWIFAPEKTGEAWWRVEPDPEEYLRLLAPFADFLETLQVNAVNLRNITTV